MECSSKADNRAGGENNHTAQAALLFLHTLSLVAFTATSVSQDFSICCQLTVVQVSAFVPSPHRHSLHSVTDVVLSPCVLRRQYSERQVVVCPYHTHTLRMSHSAVLWLQKTFFTGDASKNNFQDAQKLTDEKRPSHADFSGRKPFKKYDEQFTPALPIPSAHFYDIVGITNPPTMQVESFRREVNLVQMHCMDPEEVQTIILRLESQELSARNRISEELARCELDAMDKRRSLPVF